MGLTKESLPTREGFDAMPSEQGKVEILRKGRRSMANLGTSIRVHATSFGCAIPHPCAERGVSRVQTSTGLTFYVSKLFYKRSVDCHCGFSRTLSSVTPHPEGVYPTSCKRHLARAHPGQQHGRKRGLELPRSPTALRVLYPHKVWENCIFGRLRF